MARRPQPLLPLFTGARKAPSIEVKAVSNEQWEVLQSTSKNTLFIFNDRFSNWDKQTSDEGNFISVPVTDKDGLAFKDLAMGTKLLVPEWATAQKLINDAFVYVKLRIEGGHFHTVVYTTDMVMTKKPMISKYNFNVDDVVCMYITSKIWALKQLKATAHNEAEQARQEAETARKKAEKEAEKAEKEAETARKKAEKEAETARKKAEKEAEKAEKEAEAAENDRDRNKKVQFLDSQHWRCDITTNAEGEIIHADCNKTNTSGQSGEQGKFVHEEDDHSDSEGDSGGASDGDYSASGGTAREEARQKAAEKQQRQEAREEQREEWQKAEQQRQEAERQRQEAEQQRQEAEQQRQEADEEWLEVAEEARQKAQERQAEWQKASKDATIRQHLLSLHNAFSAKPIDWTTVDHAIGSLGSPQAMGYRPSAEMSILFNKLRARQLFGKDVIIQQADLDKLRQILDSTVGTPNWVINADDTPLAIFMKLLLNASHSE